MFHTYKNIKVLIDGNYYYCQNAAISEVGNIAPSYNINGKYNTNFVPENGIGGSLKLSYLLTGKDTLTNNISDETSIISGNFGGLSFQSGYLRSYGFSLEPNNPVTINAEIVFFDSINGTFNPNYEIAPTLPCLNVADVKILNVPGNTIGNIDNVVNLNYNYTIDVQPQYNIGQTIPERVVFGPKDITIDITSDKTNAFLPVSGFKTTLRTVLTHPENSNITQNFDCRGVLFQKDFSSSANNILINKISIRQNDLANISLAESVVPPVPIEYFFVASQGYAGTFVTITGTNLKNVESISYQGDDGQVYDNQFQIINNNQIKSFPPPESISGPITLTSKGGSTRSRKKFYVDGKPITINDIIPVKDLLESNIIISGNNFYEISRVIFNDNQEAEFIRINKNLIQATVPSNASWGYINVISDDFRISGVSNIKFVPYPKILGFSPGSGFTGEYITISGAAFSGITGVKINNLPSGNTDVFTITNNTGISVLIPSGNTAGLIKLYGQSGVTVLSENEFYPYAIITGVTPLSGRTGELIEISGRNYIQEILYNFGLNRFAVAFQGGVTGYFQRLSDIKLSGSVPSGAKSGLIHIYSPELVEYPSNTTFIVRNNPPTISYFSPISGKRQDYISVIGADLANVINVIITGNNTGQNINNSNINESVTQDYINFQIPSMSGGKYDLIVNTIEGSATGNNIYVLENPYVSGFTLLSGGIGSSITLSGLNIYKDLTQIWIDGSGTPAIVNTGSFNSSENSIQFNIPNNIGSGRHKIIVYNSVESGSGTTPFILVPLASPSGFLPISGQWGDSILLSGTYLDLVSGLSIAGAGITNYNVIGSTGIQFIIPNNSSTDYVKLYNFAGYSSSPDQLIVVPPLSIISGFTPQTGYFGSGIVISGNYLNTVNELQFSGSTGGYISVRSFSGIGSTGINVLFPNGIANGLIRAVNLRGYSYSPYTLNIISGAQINQISIYTGVFKDSIILSGSNLTGSIVYFAGQGDTIVQADNIVVTQDTGISFNVPSGIISGPIVVKGRNDVFSYFSENFIVLPTISGLDSISISSGGYLQITGINANNISNYLIISGNNGFYYNIANTNEFSGIFKTGYTEINLKLNDNFAGTGKIFLVSSDDVSFDVNNITGSITYSKKSSILFDTPITISQSSPTISSFSPTGASSSGVLTINGSNLFSTLNVTFVVGANSSLGNIISTGNTQIRVIPPSMATGTGWFYVNTPFGTANSGIFRVLSPLFISGYSPGSAHTGELVRISGISLLTITGLYFGTHNTSFTKINELGTTIISGVVPDTSDCCGETVAICIFNESENYCL